MVISDKIIKETCDKYHLSYLKFKFLEKKQILKKKFFLIYLKEEFFFEVNAKRESLNYFFPYFANEKNLSNFEIWIKSISLTENRNTQIVKNLNEGLDSRKKLKDKYGI
tara:strand:+ start:205 stop:531 length:327 start_codon:yes stop_codon:yes gene_type:complete